MALISDYITAEAALAIRQAIAEAGGREVFLLGCRGADGKVASVRVLARGNATAVAAIVEAGAYGDVVIHNHPSGDLAPSDADVQVSSVVANSGIASVIVNNDASAIYVVVEPMQRPTLQPLKPEDILTVLAPEGRLGKALPKYEERAAQKEMMAEVIDAFNHDKISVIEAGTGTGKTLAYLVPAIAWAVVNNERVVVSTHTINLQEQIMHKDLPLVRRLFAAEFKAVLVKGRGNYACLRKVHAIEEDPELFEDEEAEQLQVLVEWALHSATGDVADLSFVPRLRVWDKIHSTPETCLKGHCPFFRDCFVSLARREASTANLLITNHALLFSDIALHVENGVFSDATILPKYRRIIFDEAHNLEEVATHYFGKTVSRHAYLRTLNSMHRYAKGRESGSLAMLSVHLLRGRAKAPDAALVDEFIARIGELTQVRLPAVQFAANDTFDAIAADLTGMGIDAKGGEESGTIQYRLTPERRASELWKAQRERLEQLAATTRTYVTAVVALLKEVEQTPFEDDKIAGALLDVKSHAGWLLSFSETLDKVCNDASEEFVNWLEAKISDTYTYVSVERAPLDIAEAMIANVYEQFPTIIMTSATLTSRKKFDFLESRIGLRNYKERVSKGTDDAAKRTARPVRELLLPTPFDFHRQAMLVIPTDLDASFIDRGHRLAGQGQTLRDAVKALLLVTQGSAFVLFTSYGLLRKMARELEDELAAHQMHLLVQGTEPRDELLRRFRSESHAVLFGTDSFWAGVDVVGEALQSVIITRLPFRVPTEPIIEARSEYIDAHGGNAFTEYTVPLAVIKFRQGFGRLIRSKTDYGMVAMLDRRVIEKYYGKWFLESLPECAQLVGPMEEILKPVSEFLLRHRTAYATAREADTPAPAAPAAAPATRSRKRGKKLET